MEDLYRAAIEKESNPDYEFWLRGDLNQLAEQKKSLMLWGFDIKQNDVYPCLKKSNALDALKLIWGFRIGGWWHYKEKYIELSICTQDDFINALRIGSDEHE